jgi:hypothetical protein
MNRVEMIPEAIISEGEFSGRKTRFPDRAEAFSADGSDGELVLKTE